MSVAILYKITIIFPVKMTRFYLADLKSPVTTLYRDALRYICIRSLASVVRGKPLLELPSVPGEPLDILGDDLKRCGATGRTGTGFGIFLEEGLHLIQLRLRGERSRNDRYQTAQVPVVQCISIHQELPVVAHPLPHQQRTVRIVGDHPQATQEILRANVFCIGSLGDEAEEEKVSIIISSRG